MSISVLLLAYREEENLRFLLPRINEIFKKMNIEFEIIVIDFQIPQDNTEEVCLENGAKYMPQEAPGYAGAFRTGISNASKELILVLDADGSHAPESIPDIYELFTKKGYDVVIGSRYIAGGETNDSKASILMSKLLNFVMRLAIGINARDISTSFRLYHSAQLKKVELTRKNFDVLQEVLLKLKLNKKDFTVGEVPIIFGKRMNGMSTRKLLTYIISYINTVFILIKIRFSDMSN